jgi:hypothetical protein
MELLFKAVQAEIDRELQRAEVKFGPKNNSPHESYAVIKVELEEAMDDAVEAAAHLEEYWDAVKADDRDEQNNILFDLKRIATLAACEMIQVAAMAQKALNGYERQKDYAATGTETGR